MPRGSALRRGLLGSVITGLIQYAHCPVAVVHDEVPSSPQLPVLVGIDGSRASQMATVIALDEAYWRGAGLVEFEQPASHPLDQSERGSACRRR